MAARRVQIPQVHDGSVDPPLSKMMGSPYYVAPEIFSESYGYKVDMWSTGVVLYMLLSGNPPFRGKDNNEICGNVLTAELALDEAALPGVSEEARDFLRCVLNRDVFWAEVSLKLHTCTSGSCSAVSTPIFASKL